MPRKPTGRPTGRPPGSGPLGEGTRLTVRLPIALYQKLQAFSEGRSFTRGEPELSSCVRDLLEYALAGKTDTRQPVRAPAYNNGPTENVPAPERDENQLTESVPVAQGDSLQQIVHVPPGQGVSLEQTESAPAVSEVDALVPTVTSLVGGVACKPPVPACTSGEPAPGMDAPQGAVGIPRRRGRLRRQICAHPAERWNVKRRMCLDCDAEKQRAKYQATRQAERYRRSLG